MARSVVPLKPNVHNILSFNFCKQKFVQHGPITFAIDCNGLTLRIFKEKWTKIRTKQCGFSVPQMRQFCLFTYPPKSRWASSKKMIFWAKSASSECRSQAHLAKRKRIRRSFGFNSWTNWTLYGVQGLYAKFISMMSPKCSIVENIALHTHFLPQQQYSRVYALFLAFHTLVYRWWCHFLSLFFTRYRTYGADSASLLLKSVRNFRTNSATLPWFSGKIAIFPSAVQAYTPPYSLGGRIKLIICQIRHESSVTIHEISTSWKKKR